MCEWKCGGRITSSAGQEDSPSPRLQGCVHGCREFLRKYKNAGVAQGLADYPVVQLREAIVATGLVLHCKGVFIQAFTGNTSYDPLRSLIISLLQVPLISL